MARFESTVGGSGRSMWNANGGVHRLAGVGGGVSWGRVGSHTQLRVLAALNAARGGGLAAHAVVYACASPALVYEVQPCHPGLARATRRDEPRGQASSLQGAKRVSAALGARKCKRKCAMETEAADMEDAAAMEVLWLLQTGNSTAKKAKVSMDEHGMWTESHAAYARATHPIHQMHSMPASMMCA